MKLSDANAVYLGAVAADRVYAGVNKVWEKTVTPPSGPSSTLTAAFTPGPDRNDFTGEAGVRFGIGPDPITVTWLGVYCRTASGTRKVRIYDWFSDTVVRTVTVDFTGKTAGLWVWVPIAPLVLAAASYHAVMQEVTDGDGMLWTNALAPSSVTPIAAVTNIYSTYRVPGGALTANSLNMEYVGLDLGWGNAVPPDAFDPTAIAGCVIWLDAADLGLANDAVLTAWTNKATGPQPRLDDSLPLAIYKTNALNGRGVVRHGANGSRWRFPTTGVSTEYTCFVVARMWSNSAGRIISSHYPSGGNKLIGWWNGFMDTCYAGGFYGPQKAQTTDWRLYSDDGDATLLRLFINGVPVSAPFAPLDYWGGTFHISGYNAIGLEETCDCEVAEVLLYSRKLNDVERTSVEDYLRTKWGFPAARDEAQQLPAPPIMPPMVMP